MDLRNNAYFQSLPALVQESVWQSGLDFADESELRRFAEGIRKRD